jgi:hypothetical protein
MEQGDSSAFAHVAAVFRANIFPNRLDDLYRDGGLESVIALSRVAVVLFGEGVPSEGKRAWLIDGVRGKRLYEAVRLRPASEVCEEFVLRMLEGREDGVVGVLGSVIAPRESTR